MDALKNKWNGLEFDKFLKSRICSNFCIIWSRAMVRCGFEAFDNTKIIKSQENCYLAHKAIYDQNNTFVTFVSFSGP